MANEIATAYVKIQPTAEGIQGNLANILGGEADSAGSSAGAAFGGSFSASAASAIQSVSGKAQGVLAGIMETSIAYEAQMDRVRAITNANNEDFEALDETAQKLGHDTRYSATEVAQAMEYMGMAGWKTEQVIGGLPGVLDLATASGEDLAHTSDIVTDALTAFGMTAEQSSDFANTLAATATNSNTNVSQMGEMFKYVAPLCGSMGFELNDAALAAGLMANAGVKSSQAGTSMKNVITRIIKPTKDSAAAMEKLGIVTQDASGRQLGLREILDQVREKMGDLGYDQEAYTKGVEDLNAQLEQGTITQEEYTDQLEALSSSCLKSTESQKAQTAAMLAGSYGLSGLLAIVNASDEDYEKLANAIDASSETMVRTTDGAIIPMSQALKEGKEWTDEFNGAAAAMADTMGDNTAGRLKELESRIESLQLKAGEHLLPVAEKLLDVAIGIADWFGSMPEPMQAMAANTIAITAVAGPLLNGLTGILGVGGKIVSGMTGLVTTHIPALTSAVSASSVTITGALGAIGTAGLAAADGLLIAYDVNSFKEAADGYKAAFDAHTNETQTALENYSQLYQDKGKEVADQWAMMVYQIDTTSMSFEEAQHAISDKIETFWEGVPQNMWEGFKQGFAHYFGMGFEGPIALVTDGLNGLGEAACKVLGINSPSTVFRDIGANIVLGLSEGIRNDSSLINARNSVINDLSNFMTTLSGTQNDMTVIGGNLMTSFSNGLVDAARYAVNTAAQAAQAVVSTVRSVFQIHSPSKVFRDIGEQLPAGLVLGIEDGEDAVNGAIGNLAKNATIEGSTMVNAAPIPQRTMDRTARQAAAQTPQTMTVILELDRAQLGRAVYRLNREETQRVGVRLAGGGAV